jgi:hypothetical protein
MRLCGAGGAGFVISTHKYYFLVFDKLSFHKPHERIRAGAGSVTKPDSTGF